MKTRIMGDDRHKATARRNGRVRRVGLVLALVVLVASCAAGLESDAEPPSIVLIVIDTLRQDHLTFHGYERETSPHLERLAGESVVFQRCRAASSWTQPSTVSLLSGLYPARHGAHERAVVDDRVEFLGERLRDLGYSTAAFSGNVNVSPALGMDQGFDHFDYRGGSMAREYPDVSGLVDAAWSWLSEPSGPVFLYLHVMNVHGPYRAPPEYRERFLERPFQPFEFQGPLWKEIVRHGNLDRRTDVSHEHLHDLSARYDGAIAYTDEVLGEFIERLAGSGWLERSVLVITSDHGEELFDHGGFGHGFTLHSEVLDVPLIIRLPGGARAGGVVSEPVGLVDLPATLLEIAAGEGEPIGDGRSLLPLIEGAGLADPPAYSAELRSKRGSSFMLQKWPYRLIDVERDYTGAPPHTRLYHAGDDPVEARDLSGAQPELAREMTRRARAMRDRMEAQQFESFPKEMDPELRDRLEALGYVDAASADDAD